MKYTNKLLKITTLFFLTIGIFQSCNTAEKKEAKVQSEETTINNTVNENEAVNGLTLNNGAKWQADASTNKNVSALSSIVSASQPVTLEEYKNTGKTLQAGIDVMISECRMQGPDHDALHHWLEPLMEENKKLESASSLEQGKESFDFVNNQINIYSQYFE